MLSVLFRLWPALIPLIIFGIWYLRAVKTKEMPGVYDVFIEKKKKYMFYTLIASFTLVILTLLYYGLTQPATLVIEIENDQVQNNVQ